jgi:hypothetical protein
MVECLRYHATLTIDKNIPPSLDRCGLQT